MLAGYSVFLKKVSDQNDLVINTHISTRNAEGSSEIIGWLIGKLISRVEVVNDDSFKDLLESCKIVMAEGMEHIQYDFPWKHFDEKQSMGLNLLNNFNTVEDKAPNFKSHHYNNVDNYLDFTFDMQVLKNGIWILCKYKNDLVDKSEISEVCDEFVEVIKTAINTPDIKMKYWSKIE